MATLAGNSIASSYTSLLKLDGNTDSTAAGNGSNAIQVKTGDNDATPLFLNTDRLGIGTANVESLLHIESTQNATMRIHNTTTGYAPQLLFEGNVGANADHLLGKVDATWDGASNVVSSVRFESGADTSNKDDGVISFWTSSASSSVSERMRIDSAGNVGIGTASPKHYSGTSGTVLSIHNSSFRGILELSGASNSDGGVIGALTFSNTENDAASGALAQMYTEVETSDSNDGNDSGGHLLFFTKPEAGTLAEAMRIASNGDVSIGTTANYGDLTVGGTGEIISGRASSGAGSFSMYEGGTGRFVLESLNGSGGLAIKVPTTEAMRIDSSGNVGIGTTVTAGNALTIAGDNVLLKTNNTFLKGVKSDASTEAQLIGIDGSNNVLVGDGTGLLKLDANSRISLSNNDAGSGNTIFGELAGNSIQSGGNNNVIIGDDAGLDLTTADENVLIGKSAGANLLSSDDNVAIGASALATEDTGTRNVAIGYQSLTAQSGSSTTANTAVGYGSAKALTTGVSNVAVGYLSLGTGTTTGNNNVAIGRQTLEDATSATDNTAVGHQAGANVTTGNTNVAVGRNSLVLATACTDVVSIGAYSMDAVTDSTDVNGSVAIGKDSLGGLTTGGKNVAVGYLAGSQITTGDSNIALGHQAMDEITTGDRNIAIGHNSIGNAQGGSTSGDSKDNIAIGYQSQGGAWADAECLKNVSIGSYSLDGALNGALQNTAVGYASLGAVTQGDNNVAVGMEAGANVTTGNSNIAIGVSSLLDANSGESENIAIGSEAMRDVEEGTNTRTADNNVAIGSMALKGGTLAASQDLTHNVAIGWRAFDATGVYGQLGTVAIGSQALGATTYGSANTAVGYNSGDTIITGSNNTLIGYNSDVSANDASNQTVIGKDATGQADNSVTLGNSDVTAVHMAQDSHATVYSGGEQIKGSGNNTMWRVVNNTMANGVEWDTGIDTSQSFFAFVGATESDNTNGDTAMIRCAGGTITLVQGNQGYIEVNSSTVASSRTGFYSTSNTLRVKTGFANGIDVSIAIMSAT